MTTPDLDSPTPTDNEALLSIVRSILLAQDREQLEALEHELRALNSNTTASNRALTARINTIFTKLTELDDKTQTNADVHILAERLAPVMTRLVRQTIKDSPDDMAEAIGPVMGEAIRVQIRDSRKEMVEAIYPIIGETIQRAISEFAKELQRNIDARLKSPLTPKGFMKRFRGRLRGISGAEIAFRESLPFLVREIFLIQHHSGLLLAHHQPQGGEGRDSDIISAMLTAIRDFVQDSFEPNPSDANAELGEIRFGDQQIAIESGKHIYLAVVYSGIEPEGFRAALHQFVADLHVNEGIALRDYRGDPETLPLLSPALDTLTQNFSAIIPPNKPLSRGQKVGLAGAAIGLILVTTLACFYVWFTMALWPLVFPESTHTPTASPTASATASVTASLTATLTATSTITPSPLPTLTDTPSPSPTAPPAILMAQTTGNLNLRADPHSDSVNLGIVLADTQVQVLAIYGEWIQISWKNGDEIKRGWISSRWVQLPEDIPAMIVTPVNSAP